MLQRLVEAVAVGVNGTPATKSATSTFRSLLVAQMQLLDSNLKLQTCLSADFHVHHFQVNETVATQMGQLLLVVRNSC